MTYDSERIVREYNERQAIREQTNLAHGEFVVEYPQKIDAHDVEHMEQWFAATIRRLRRLTNPHPTLPPLSDESGGA